MRLRDVVFLPPDQRRQIDFTKTKKRGKRVKRKEFSRDELIAYIKDNEYTSAIKLRRGRSAKDPSVNDYIKEFGKWSAAKKIAFGDVQNFDKFANQDAAYMVQAVMEFGLWKARQWQKATHENKEIVPSMSRVIKEWGSFSNMIAYTYQVHMKTTLDRYISLWRDLGKKPTMIQCEDEGVNLEIPIEHFGGKREMDSFLSEMNL